MDFLQTFFLDKKFYYQIKSKIMVQFFGAFFLRKTAFLKLYFMYLVLIPT